MHAPLIGSVCPGRRSRSSRTHQAIPGGLSSSLLCRFSVFTRPALKTSRTLRFPTPKAVRRSSSSLRTGSWEVECASTPGTISLLPGRRRDPSIRSEALPRPVPPRRTFAPTPGARTSPGPPSCWCGSSIRQVGGGGDGFGVEWLRVICSGLRLLGCLSGGGQAILRNLMTFNACGSVHFQCTLRFPIIRSSRRKPGSRATHTGASRTWVPTFVGRSGTMN